MQVYTNCTCVEQAARDLGSKRARKWWRPPPPPAEDVPSPLALASLLDAAPQPSTPPPAEDLPSPLALASLLDADLQPSPPETSSVLPSAKIEEEEDNSPLTVAVEGFCPSDCNKVFYIVGTEAHTNLEVFLGVKSRLSYILVH